MTNQPKNFKVGDKVQLWPSSNGWRKVAEILDVNDLGWEFKFLPGTSDASDYKVGEIFFVSHSHTLTMIKL